MRRITPFRASFPDVHMGAVELVAEGDNVVGRFTDVWSNWIYADNPPFPRRNHEALFGVGKAATHLTKLARRVARSND